MVRMRTATGMQEEQNVGNVAAQRGPLGRLPAVRAKIARGLFVELWSSNRRGRSLNGNLDLRIVEEILPRTWSS